MFRYLVRRTLWAALLFIVITFVTFVIFYVGPNNPARAVCGGEQAKRECLVRATAKLGLDQPMPVQYWKFLQRLVFHRDLGQSFATSQSVNERIKKAAPVTASLVFGGADALDDDRRSPSGSSRRSSRVRCSTDRRWCSS